MPIGTIISFMGTIPPENYLACDGTEYNIEDYSALADFFEVQFGTKNNFGGDGTTTFALPDLQGNFLRGTGNAPQQYGGSGASVGEQQEPTVQATVYPLGGAHRVGACSVAPGPETPYINADYELSGGYRREAGSSSSSAGWSGVAIATRPTNTSVLYCIKAV